MCEGGGFSVEKPPPSRSLPRETGVGKRWGRGRFSKRSASPPDPLSRRVAGNRLVCSFGVVRPCELGAASCLLVESTAADRAAADVRGGGRTPPPAYGGHLPFQGRLCVEVCPKGSLLLRKHARSSGEAATGYCFVPSRHTQRALRSPFGNLRPITSSNYMVSNVGRSRRLCQPP